MEQLFTKIRYVLFALFVTLVIVGGLYDLLIELVSSEEKRIFLMIIAFFVTVDFISTYISNSAVWLLRGVPIVGMGLVLFYQLSPDQYILLLEVLIGLIFYQSLYQNAEEILRLAEDRELPPRDRGGFGD